MRKRAFVIALIIAAVLYASGDRPTAEPRNRCYITYEQHKLDAQDDYNRCLYQGGWISAAPVVCSTAYYVEMGYATAQYDLCLMGFGTEE